MTDPSQPKPEATGAPGTPGAPGSPGSSDAGSPEQSMYEAIGGEATFRRIVRGFYAQVPDDDILGPMYPENDMAGAEDRLHWFLTQYWGGPRTYQEQRGNPMLRRRHFPFAIDDAAAERWLELMARSLAQIDAETINDEQRAAIWNHMERVAYMMINQPR